MTEDTEPYRANKTVGPESGNGGPDVCNNGKGKVPATRDGPHKETDGPNNSEAEQGQTDSDGEPTNTLQEAGQSGDEPSGQNKETGVMLEDLKKQLQVTKDELAAAKERASVVASELKETEEELSKAQTALAKSKDQSKDSKNELAAAKKRAREAEFKLKKTEEDCIRETTRANNAESEVQLRGMKIKEWEAWQKQQEQQVQESFKNSRNAEAVVSNLEKELKDTKTQLQDTKKELDDTKTKRKTEANLEKQLKDTKQKLDAYKEKTSVAEFHLEKTKKELLGALQRAKDAENERAGLFQMINGATIQRDNRSPPGSFPDGDQITKMATKAAILTWEYLMDISDFLKIDPLHAAKSGLWRALKFAEDAAEARVVKKKEHLAEFTEGEIPPEESLGHLFWKQTMQHVMKQKLDKPYDSFFVEWVGSDKKLKAIVEMDEKHKDELEERNIGAFMELHFKLRLACRFSDPECFLWPVVGTTVPFSSKHHNQQKTPDKRKRKAKAGESVLVVYPGLYFRNPEEPDCEPVVRAMVAVL